MEISNSNFIGCPMAEEFRQPSVTTNALGKGTVNFAVNMLDAERALLGRAAFEAGSKSIGEFIREKYLEAMRGTHWADKIEAVRQHHRAVKMGVVSACVALGFLVSLFTSNLDAYRQFARRNFRRNKWEACEA